MWHWSLPILPRFQPFKILYVLRFSSPKVPNQRSQFGHHHNLHLSKFIFFSLTQVIMLTLRISITWRSLVKPAQLSLGSHRVSWTVKKWHGDLHRPRVSLPGVLRHIHIVGVPLVMLRPEDSSEADTVTLVLWQNVWQMWTRELWPVHHGHWMNPPPLTQAPESATEPGLPTKKRLMAALSFMTCTLWFAKIRPQFARWKPHLHVATKVIVEPKTTASQSNSPIRLGGGYF